MVGLDKKGETILSEVYMLGRGTSSASEKYRFSGTSQSSARPRHRATCQLTQEAHLCGLWAPLITSAPEPVLFFCSRKPREGGGKLQRLAGVPTHVCPLCHSLMDPKHKTLHLSPSRVTWSS